MQYDLDAQQVRQTNRIDPRSKTIIQNFVTNIFIKEVNLILYEDCKDHLFRKNNIASVFLDDFIICYVEEVKY